MGQKYFYSLALHSIETETAKTSFEDIIADFAMKIYQSINL